MAKVNSKDAVLRPLGDRVLIKPLETKGEATTASGIILPGKEGDAKNERGTVVATGPGRIGDDNERIPVAVKTGDKVLYKRGYAAEDVEWNGDELILIGESDVLAVIS